MKKTVIIGASNNPERYSYKAAMALQSKGHEITLVGIHEGKVNDIVIQTDKPAVANVDTITLYVGPKNQDAWLDYILSLKPKRVVFNPGTENPAFEEKLKDNNIEILEACTLVMLSIGNY